MKARKTQSGKSAAGKKKKAPAAPRKQARGGPARAAQEAQAVAQLRAGNYAAAEAILRSIAELTPDDPGAHNNLGVALKAQGKFTEAIDCYRRSLALKTDEPGAWNNLGNALKLSGNVDEATASYRRALELDPRHVDAWFNLGTALLERGEVEPAQAAYREVLALNPRHRDALANLGVALRRSGRLDEAIDCGQRAMAIDPRNLTTLRNLCHALDAAGRHEEAEAGYRRALALDPRHAETLTGLGTTLARLLRVDEAIATQRQALAIEPDYALAHLNLALALLLSGNLAEGWKEYEWRWRSPEFAEKPFDYPRPQWRGEDITGRTILLHHEQGFGDTLQFIRYAPLIAQRGARVIAGVQPELARLLRTIPGVEVITHGAPVPEYHVHASLLSLPLAFGTVLETVPAAVPYLRADPALAARWRERLGAERALKIGLVWAGKASYKQDLMRSLRLADFAPLARLPGIALYSLQKGDRAARPEDRIDGMRFTDCSTDLTDFADTAALVANLDLVISADTAVAHLAGAMARPVWLLSRQESEWRWLLGRNDSPWYPTLRLFRQRTRGDWAGVIASVGEALGAIVRARSAS